MKKILHILTTGSLSGAENVCINLINISKNEYECYYCSPVGSIKNKLEEENINYIGLDKFSLQEVKKAINRCEPDIIHAHDIRASFYAAICTGKIPIVSHIHGKFKDMGYLSVRSIIYYFASLRFNRIIYVSKSIYNEFLFKKILGKKGILLENQIDTKQILNRIKNIDSAPYYDFSFIGRLEEVKNPIRFINLIYMMQKKHPKIKACMVGSGTLELECKTLIESKKINIDLVGFKKEPLYYLLNSKALVMTSISEGIPMVALESLACGKPIIATPTDGLMDIIKENHNGFICKTDQDFIEKMNTILNDEKKRAEMSVYIKNNEKDEYGEYGRKLKLIYSEIYGEY